MLNADLKEFEFTSSFDELVISAVIAVPVGNVCGVVQIVHGLNEHKERYYPFMDYLAEEGFITVIHDCRGHDDSLNGLVLLGTPCYSRFSPITRCIHAVSSKKPGSRFRSEKIYDTVGSTLGKGFEQSENSWRCSDSEAVAEFNNDPLCSFEPTLNEYEEMLGLIRRAYSSGGWELKNPSLPVRFVSGKDDPCFISEKKFFSAVFSLEKIGYESISHRLFDGMRHEILNEKNSINVWKDI